MPLHVVSVLALLSIAAGYTKRPSFKKPFPDPSLFHKSGRRLAAEGQKPERLHFEVEDGGYHFDYDFGGIPTIERVFNLDSQGVEGISCTRGHAYHNLTIFWSNLAVANAANLQKDVVITGFPEWGCSLSNASRKSSHSSDLVLRILKVDSSALGMLRTELHVLPVSPVQLFRNLYIDLSWYPLQGEGRHLQESCGDYTYGLNYDCQTQKAKDVYSIGPLACSNCYAALKATPGFQVETDNLGVPTKIALDLSATFEVNFEVRFSPSSDGSWKSLFSGPVSDNLIDKGLTFTMPLFGSLVSAINEWTVNIGIYITYQLKGQADPQSTLEGVFQTRQVFQWSGAQVAWTKGTGLSTELGTVSFNGSTVTEDAKRSSTRSEFSSKRSKGTSDFSGSDDSSEGSIRLFGNEEQEIFRKPLASVAQVIDPELKTKGRFFQTLSAVLALANLVELGLEADYKCNIGRCESEPIWELLTQIFTILPLAENGIRLAEAKPRRFFCGEKTKVKYKLDIVNCIDTVLVVLRILDVWLLSLVGIESGLRLVSGFRIIRMGPAVRHWQATKELRELWIVIGAVAETVKTLFWVGVMLIFVIWIFGILVSMSLLDRSGDEFDFTYSQWSFQEYWGSVPRSAFSLFQVATRDNWISSMVSPLVKTEPLLLVIFGSYFCIGALALMNSIIAVVVECTLSAARSSSDREEEEKLRADAAVMDSLRKIFHDGDTDGSGELDMDELHALICKHQVRDRLKMLRIPFADLDLLFTLLDTDCTGNVNTDMFFRGCAKLRGPAMACDLHQLSIDLKQNLERCDHNSERIRQVNETLAIVLDHVDDMDISIMKSDVDFKDPVLAARQVRPKTSKSDVIRGRWLMPMAPNEQSMWMDLDRQAKERELASKLNLMLDAPVEASNSKVRDRLDITDSQPPPPPMPDRAKRLDDVRLSEDAKANQVATAMKKIHRIHRFD